MVCYHVRARRYIDAMIKERERDNKGDGGNEGERGRERDKDHEVDSKINFGIGKGQERRHVICYEILKIDNHPEYQQHAIAFIHNMPHLYMYITIQCMYSANHIH